MAEFLKGWNRDVILDAISKLPRADDGSINSVSIEIETALTVFVKFDQSLAEREKGSVIFKALRGIKSQQISENDLRKHISRAEGEFIRRPYEKYVIASSISIRNDQLPISGSFRGAKITVSPKMRRKIALSRKRIAESSDGWEVYEQEKDFSALTIEIQARSVSEAIEKGLRAATYFRGVINYHLNATPYSSFDSRIRFSPKNKIRIGRIHTLHNASGDEASDGFWYESELPADKEPYSDSRALEIIQRYYQKLSSKLLVSKFGDIIEEGLIRYCESLDVSDPQSAFLKMWSVAEYLTGNAKSYDITIDRFSTIFDSPDFIKTMLQKHRIARNSFTHSGSSHPRIVHFTDELQWYVGQFITFMIWNAKGFDNYDELIKFLDMPKDIKDLLTNEIVLHLGIN